MLQSFNDYSIFNIRIVKFFTAHTHMIIQIWIFMYIHFNIHKYIYMNTSKNTCVYIEVHMCKYKFEHIQFCTVYNLDRERRKRAKRLAGSPGPGRRNRMFDVMNLEHYHTFPQVLRLQLAQQTMLGVMKWIQKLLVVGPLGWVLIRWCTKIWFAVRCYTSAGCSFCPACAACATLLLWTERSLMLWRRSLQIESARGRLSAKRSVHLSIENPEDRKQ